MISRWIAGTTVPIAIISLGCCPLMVGCSNSPSAVPTLAVDPADAAERALQEYDRDGDGALSREELATCAGLLTALADFDGNGDGKVTGKELEDRFRFWVDSPTRIAAVTCIIRLDGRPLEDATVKLVPEPFLSGAVMPGSGVTMENGMAMLRTRDEDLPPEWKGLRGVQLGVYKIEITHPHQEIPSRYNSQTTLGQEVSPSTPAQPLVFDLKSR